MLQDNYFKTKLTLSKPGDKRSKMIYSFEISNKKVVNERLIVYGKVLVDRDSDKALFNGTPINPPIDKLVVQVRRDRNEYPDVEALMEWAEGVIAISCSNINPYTILNGPEGFINPISFSDLVDSLTISEKKSVIKDAKNLGYNILGMTAIKVSSDIKLVTIKEAYVRNEIFDIQLSSGMMRVLYLLCFLKNMKHKKNYSMLLIDDLGEGLDYSRAKLLGEKIFDTCENENLQMIASSNDAFLMDVIDISKWQIIRRKNTKLTILNQTNTPILFNSFRMTGLSNFDLLSSDFIDNFCIAK